MPHRMVSQRRLAPSQVRTSTQEDHPDPSDAQETLPVDFAVRGRLLWHCPHASFYRITVEHPGEVPVPAKDVSWRVTTHHSSA